MKNFTFKSYLVLLQEVLESKRRIMPLADFVQHGCAAEPVLVLRHDVDRMHDYAVAMAEMEHQLGVCASYYFRSKDGRFNESAVRRIASLGHEVGYHYENLARCNGNPDDALRSFSRELTLLREISPVQTITMHGSPMRPWDNRDLWKHCDYKSFGLLAEPYFDLDFTRVLYITDAGRGWNDPRVNRRDMPTGGFRVQPRNVDDVIKGFKTEYPAQVLLNIHPNNWSRNCWDSLLISGYQSFKNFVKRIVLKRV